MHNEIYDMDKKLCFSDCSSSMSVPSPCSSQSSRSSSTSGYSSNNSFPIMNLPRYDVNNGDINMTFMPAQNFCMEQFTSQRADIANLLNDGKGTYTSQLVLHEEPTEKFRFRYKSEMHGTHGSLNGQRSEKNKKTFPEVELKNFNGLGVIRCSLYQTNLDRPSPHSHQLVVRKEDNDEVDPHDVHVSPEKGYIARFENMGIIHTAKKNICDALFAKKKQKLRFELGGTELSQRQEKTLRDEAEREGKLMNLNQVRLCFEAFKIVEGGWMKICEPIYSRPINNRKSALTGELKICRLSSVAGSAAGGEDLILLVEKVSKKNIQVRFFEMRDDDLVWEAFGEFSDADVHHQYAITVRTPPYKNKDIDKSVEVSIELVRKSDDERSTPVDFRYKPRETILNRKRRRTSYSTSSSSAVSSSELPEPVLKGMYHQADDPQPTISQEYNKDEQLKSLFEPGQNYQGLINSFLIKVTNDSDELQSTLDPDFFLNSLNSDLFKDVVNEGVLQTDGEVSVHSNRHSVRSLALDSARIKTPQQHHPTMKFFIAAINDKRMEREKIIATVRGIFEDYSVDNDNGDTILHEIVKNGQQKDAMILFNILSKLNLYDLISQTNNLGQTALHAACVFDQSTFIRPLLSVKCDPNVQDNNGNTAMHIAIADNLKECLEGFASYISSAPDGAQLNVNLGNDNGFTPLHLAIRQKNLAFVEMLLAKCNASAKVASSRDGNNALHLAVQNQSPKIIKCLLQHSKVQINVRNRSGHTAIDLAKTLEPEVKKEILALLMTKLPLSNNSLYTQTADAIKDEPEDENDSSTEEDESLSSEVEERNEETHFKRLLQDEKVCSRLGQLLEVDNKWKKLGSELKLDHLLFLWSSAEAMLKYLVATDEMSAMTILNALQAVDPETASTAMTMLRT